MNPSLTTIAGCNPSLDYRHSGTGLFGVRSGPPRMRSVQHFLFRAFSLLIDRLQQFPAQDADTFKILNFNNSVHVSFAFPEHPVLSDNGELVRKERRDGAKRLRGNANELRG